VSRLVLSVGASDPDGVEIVAELSAGAFSGCASAWFDADALRRFARRLRAYPLPASERPRLTSGFGAPGAPLDDLHVLLEVYPLGAAGELGARVALAVPDPSGRVEGRRSVAAEMRVGYEALSRFAAALAALADDPGVEAVLEGD
jgi:hypothetical protein